MKVRLGLILSIAMMAQPLSAIEEDIEIIPVAESSYTAVAVKSIAQVAAQVVGPGGTTLDLLMKSVEVHAPQVIQAQASAEAAVARETIAQAPFDPILNGSYDGRMTGFMAVRLPMFLSRSGWRALTPQFTVGTAFQAAHCQFTKMSI